MRTFLWLLAAVALGVSTEQTRGAATQARLVLSAEAAKPGDVVTAGVVLEMAAPWHTYWRNGGEAGRPTEIKWKLPSGLEAGEIQWPVPKKETVAGLTTYIYEDEVVLLVPLKISQSFAVGEAELSAMVEWLECETGGKCVPGKQEVSAKLLIGDETKASADAELIEQWKRKLPQTGATVDVSAEWESAGAGESRSLIIATSLPAKDFFAYESTSYDIPPATELVSSEGKVRLRKTVSKSGDAWPMAIQGLLIAGGQAYEVNLKIGDSPRATSPLSMAALLSALGFAFLGGLILNVMPCVLPVIALKILGFVNQSGQDRARVRKFGILYALGVVVSFVVLAGFVIGVQQAGRIASWGMQMQNLHFVIAMAILMTLVALNLFGVFEITLGGRAMNAATDVASRQGAAGAFFNGVLATVLAVPCTAPFLAAALGFAFAQPPAIIVLVFVVIALGLATPYVVLSWNPSLLKFLPKPGPWMQHFKVAMGFPMLATVVWLYRISLAHLERSQAFWFGIFLVSLACSAWIWGQFVQRASRRRVLAGVISIVLVAVAGSYAATREEHKWQAWSREAVAKSQAAGRPVLVDFTADWCPTCKVNFKIALDTKAVREKLKEINAVPMIADFTKEDPVIAEELHRFGRDAVPLVVVFPKNPQSEPIVLPPALTPQIVLEALTKAAE